MRKEIEDYLEKVRNRVFHLPDESMEITDEEFQAIADTALVTMKGKLSVFLVSYLAIWLDMVVGYDTDFEDIEITDVEPDYVYEDDEEFNEPQEDRKN